jgi:hypothetical protein
VGTVVSDSELERRETTRRVNESAMKAIEDMRLLTLNLNATLDILEGAVSMDNEGGHSDDH